MFRPDSRLFKAALGLAACACLAVAQATAATIDLTPAGGNGTVSAPVSLATLLADPTGSVTVGDKVFTGFGYSGTNDMPSAANVNVLGLKDSLGNWGLRFQGGFQDLPGNGGSDAHISFMVEVAAAQAAQGWRITDAHLAIAGAATGGPNSYFIVDESLNSGATSIGTLEAAVSTLGQGITKLSDAIIFSPVVKLNVVKDILAQSAAGNSLPSRGTVIDQSFSQQVPEPATVALFGMTSLALVSVSRRRQS